jgi:ParB family transcriptional regulator, chromosome partitioning protein
LTNLAEPGASITWARELKNLNRKLFTPTVLDAVVKKINEQEITNSKEVRKLRQILKDPVAKDNFLSDGGTLETALKTFVPSPAKKTHGLIGDIDQLSESLQRYPWTTLVSMKGDQQLLRKLEETENLIKELKKALYK